MPSCASGLSLVIDWLTFTAPCAHAMPITGGSVISIDPAGEVVWKVAKRSAVRGSHDTTLQVRTCARTAEPCTHVEISGNPVKWFQGHNLWGTDDLPSLVVATLECLASSGNLDLSPSASDRQAWAAGHCQLTRVDCTESFHLNHRGEVLAFLRAMEQSAHLAHRGRGQLVKGSTLYFGQHSRRWSLKLYAKGQEIEAKGHEQEIIASLPHAKAWADRTLRAELTLRSMELKRLGLSSVTDWFPLDGVPFEASTRLLRERMGGLTMTTTSRLDDDVLQAMRPALRMAYENWRTGADLRGVLSRPTFYRYRAQLLEHGIDIATVQAVEASNVVPLVRILEAVPVGVPDWAQGTHLYFEPRRVA